MRRRLSTTSVLCILVSICEYNFRISNERLWKAGETNTPWFFTAFPLAPLAIVPRLICVDESSIILLNLNLIIVRVYYWIKNCRTNCWAAWQPSRGSCTTSMWHIHFELFLSLVMKNLYDRGPSILHPIFPKKGTLSYITIKTTLNWRACPVFASTCLEARSLQVNYFDDRQ